MKISLNWLREHLDWTGKSVEELEQLLTFAGVEIEAVIAQGVQSDRVVVAQVMEAEQHPNADRLKVTKVDAGEGEWRQIVCGAQNYRVGDKVPCALPGAILPNGFKIGETTMRGVLSRGMLCAASEIGWQDRESGLMILDADAPVGQPIQELLGADVLLEVEVTPNRPDLLSHRGLARELSALLQQELKPRIEVELATRSDEEGLFIESRDACPFYSMTRLTGVKVAPSPPWLQERLCAIGLRPINNVVDITNFVLHELGQPLHAFDAAKVGLQLQVRAAVQNEAFSALNGVTYALNQGDTVISDETGAVLALAGVMGGVDSSVTAETTEVILESAFFDPSKVRATARALLLSSDSSYRFERGVDPQMILPAASLALELLVQLAEATVVGETRVNGSLPVNTGVVELDVARLHQLMGGSIELAEAEGILVRLGLMAVGENQWQVPSWRADLQRHIDLVEEIARVFGLDRVPARLQTTLVEPSVHDQHDECDMQLRRSLAARGFYEVQTLKLIAKRQLIDALPLRVLQEKDVVELLHPLSEDHAVLRPSLAPGLVACAERNVRHGLKSLRFFEMGRVFRHHGNGKARDAESDVLSLLLAGPLAPASWLSDQAEATLYDLKAAVAALVPQATVQWQPRERMGFALGAEVVADGQVIGVAARLKPARERELDLGAPTWVVELDLQKLRKLLSQSRAVVDLPQFPGSSRDAALNVPLDLMAGTIDQTIAQAKIDLLVGFECFDVFVDATGEKLSVDRKSLAYRFIYRSADRTLKAEEVDAAHQAVLAHLGQNLDVRLR